MLLALAVAVTPAAPATADAGPRATSGAIPIGGPGLAGHGVLVTYGSDAAPLPKVAAASWVLADLTTGEILAAKAPHLQRPPASTLKTLTALTLIPQLDPQATYRSTWSDVSVIGSRAGMVDRAPYLIEDLFYGLLLPSGNDAARALAHANGGVAKTVVQMNKQAHHLQAMDTVAKTPHGLDTPGQVSSAYDLALIARAALQLQDFRTYVSSQHYAFPGLMPKKKAKKRATFEIWNQNPLIKEGYRGAIGVKTGYTTLAGRTFVGAATRKGHSLVVTIMGVQEPTTTAARDLLNWGFAEGTHVTPVGTLVDPVEDAAETTPAPDTDSPVTAAAPLTATVPDGTASRSWPGLPLVGVLLVAAGLAIGAVTLRNRRREARGRARLMDAARRTR